MSRPARILLVEDNEDNRIIYRTMLEFAGHEVTEAPDGQAAIDIALASIPDVILMDLSLPVIDGLEATRILRADARTAFIPIIAITAHALATDRARAADAGVDAYIAKPAEPREVLNEVERWIDKTGGEQRLGTNPATR